MFAAGAALRIPLDPVMLSYVMALHGIRPRLPGEGFTYAEIGCGTAERLILLAASNPEGIFFGFDPDLEKLSVAAAKAEQCQVKNVTFSQADAAQLKEAVEAGVIGTQCFDYLVYSETGNPDKESLAALHDCAMKLLRENGVIAHRYRVYDDAKADTLLFQNLLAALLPEQPGEAFARDWRSIAQLYFAAYPQQAEAFDKALAEGKGRGWLEKQAALSPKSSRTIEAGEVFSGKEFTFLGSAHLPANYMELSTPENAHGVLTARRQHPLYEAIKDLAVHNMERIDIWGREPLKRIDNLVTLFGGFNFGTTEPPERIARTVIFQGKSINFAGPLYDGILSLATVMPVTIGDLVHHESLAGIDPATLLNSVQLLIACGLLQPMRASYEGGVDMDNPKLIGSYNQSLRSATLDLQDYAFASTVTGRPVILSGMNCLVLQALDRGGLDNIAALLGDQLMRLSSHPYLRPLNLGEPQRAVEEAIRQIETVFHQSMVRWFSLGIINTEEPQSLRATG